VKTGVSEALILSLVMAAVIFLCRIFPFLFFRGKSGPPSGAPSGAPSDAESDAVPDAADGNKAAGRISFYSFIEKIVPPVAMTVLAFNALTGQVKAGFAAGGDHPLRGGAIPALVAAAFTALIHLWRRNPLISIFSGTALYMILLRVC